MECHGLVRLLHVQGPRWSLSSPYGRAASACSCLLTAYIRSVNTDVSLAPLITPPPSPTIEDNVENFWIGFSFHFFSLQMEMCLHM
jgi:hypothetical protein